eukprot:TRINITY_DN1707_c0_g1_i1.p1 TRINITY_DN1707_c0_g1~~TRINITY_DN1707_c0_g1_i1.p1  ORF type:complete len:707 (-),score=279.50 TRINITY_DN1707_c0_g1_i1:34-2154(-)
MEVDNEKLNSLTHIFGRDIPAQVIREALIQHKNNLDETVNYLLERRPESFIQPQQPQQQQPPVQKDQEDLRALQNMFGSDLSQSVIATVLHSNSGDVSNAVDELLNITSKEIQPTPQPAPRDMDQTKRMQREIQEMEDFKRLQQRMQEEELKLAEETRRIAEQKVREREQRALDDQIRRAEEKRLLDLAQIEKVRKQAEEDEKRRQLAKAVEIKAQEQAAERIAAQLREMEAEKARIELQKKKLVEEQRVRDAEEAMRRMSLDQEEKRRRDLIREEEVALKRRREEEELALRRRIEEEELVRKRAQEEEEFVRRRAQEQERIRQEAEKTRLAAERAQLALREEKQALERELLLQKARQEEEQRKQEDELRKLRFLEEQRCMKEEIKRQFLEDEERRQREFLAEEERKRKLEEDKFEESVVILPTGPANGKEMTCEIKENNVTVTWDILPSIASPSNWIAIHSVHNPTKPEHYHKTGGISTGSFDFKGLTPGYHIVHFYLTGTYTPTYSSEPIRIGNEAKVAVKVEGDQIRINYTPSSNPSRDWVGIYVPSERNKTYLFTTYGNAAGEMLVAAPRPVGEYEARVFYAGSNYNEQCKCSFRIVDNDKISCLPSTVEQGATIRAEWVMRTKEPSSYNWIGLYSTVETDNTKYLVSTYISTATVGGTDIIIPKDLTPGCYELRLFVNAVGKYITYKSSNLVNVVASSATK